jgi:hypothetical protein
VREDTFSRNVSHNRRRFMRSGENTLRPRLLALVVGITAAAYASASAALLWKVRP